eukprot:5391968-Pyramimonas_sp.AAC.1
MVGRVCTSLKSTDTGQGVPLMCTRSCPSVAAAGGPGCRCLLPSEARAELVCPHTRCRRGLVEGVVLAGRRMSLFNPVSTLLSLRQAGG